MIALRRNFFRKRLQLILLGVLKRKLPIESLSLEAHRGSSGNQEIELRQ
jgi:hypothetical protein